MKTSKIIWYIVIAAVVYYIIYKAYTNYQISGSIFSSTDPLAGKPDSASRLAVSSYAYRGTPTKDPSGRNCTCPGCTWTSNGWCWPPAKPVA